MYSLSNRRLFMFRVLHRRGLVDKVNAMVYSLFSERVQRLRFDPRFGCELSKWERSFSSRCDGTKVVVDSQYWRDHLSPQLGQRNGKVKGKAVTPVLVSGLLDPKP